MELEGFIQAFIRRDKRDRWRTLLSTLKGRHKLVRTLDHGFDFDPRWAERLEPGVTVEEIAKLLAPAREGYLISSNWELDGRTMEIIEALENVVEGDFGTIIVCIPDRLAYFESEERYQHYLLRKPPKALPLGERELD